eukprot:TRINITY_DN20557_c0_g1_i2.p2 TRINITY_DN20557_c0_g1~~TRINITY_DN20557_c0_g1_i2.p2  ORF type:complete len:100 (+),score=38.82 TRINITY_DN20557_c0_g1_i2:89-388(+)
MIRRPPRSTLSSSSAASDVYKRQDLETLLKFSSDKMAGADGKLDSLTLWVTDEVGEAADARHGNKKRLTHLEIICEALSFSKFGEKKQRVWYGLSLIHI